MDTLISVVNQLQDICNAHTIPLNIDLPQIVVVGAQSSGKSSVIESIVRREFLPRGTGLVTRRPIVIRLNKINSVDHHNTNGDHVQQDYAKFNHSDKEYTDFDEVREEIERETDRLCGTNKGIRPEPITLNIYSKNVVNLTLVDLPGIVKIPVGDQPEDIEIQVCELVTRYIENPNSIILAVTAANVDFACSEATKLARQVDPEGRRTLAVLTKLDTMDHGTDTLKVLLGECVKIRLGIIGVVNRSQKDIDNKKSIEKALEDEAAFLECRYPSIADRNGQPYLAKRLSQLLIRHIRDCLPDLKSRVGTLVSQLQAHLNSFGHPVKDKPRKVSDILTEFSRSYCETIMCARDRISTTELGGGARIQYIFYHSFVEALSKINPLETLDTTAILTATRNAGERRATCVPHVFRLLVASQIKRLEVPSLQCVELVHEELSRFTKHCSDEVRLELYRFPNLKNKIKDVLNELLNDGLKATKEMVINLIGIRSSFIDADDPRLQLMGYNEIPMQNGVVPLNDDDQELRDCEILKRKINAYFNIARDEIRNSVPGAICYCMLDHLRSNLNSTLCCEIYKHEYFDDLLYESDDIARRREETSEKLASLKKAREILDTVIDKKQ